MPELPEVEVVRRALPLWPFLSCLSSLRTHYWQAMLSLWQSCFSMRTAGRKHFFCAGCQR
ncbi:MAG: hypothetical protein Q9M22_06990 [Mariprofundaceae bacterium]|nr:hypothetical protein [Mariprofundaceae bacterium]